MFAICKPLMLFCIAPNKQKCKLINFLFYYIMVPPPTANIETALKDNNIKYILYEQFGLRVLDLIDKDYLIIQHNQYGSYTLYKNKPINYQSKGCNPLLQSKITERFVPGGFLSKYKSIYYPSSFIVDNLVMSASCFKK